MADADFYRSVREQMAINRARTPTQRMQALCELLDLSRDMAPDSPAARKRRNRAAAARSLQREQLRAQFRRLIAAAGRDASPGL